MSDVKKNLLKEIDEKIKKHRQAKLRAEQRNTIDGYVLEFIDNIEELNTMTSSEEDWKYMASQALQSMHDRLKGIDYGCKVDVSWYETVDGSKKPQVNAVIIKWSKFYQEKNNVDAELSVDVASLLFK